MTALPRNPVEVSAASLQSQNMAAGRAASNRAQTTGGGDVEGDSMPKFATLLGKVGEMASRSGKADTVRQAIPRELDPVGRGIDLPVEPIIDQQSGDVGNLAAPAAQVHPSDTVTLRQNLNLDPSLFPHGEEFQDTRLTTQSAVSTSALSLTGKSLSNGVVSSDPTPQTPKPAGQPVGVAVSSQQVPNSEAAQEPLAGRLTEPAIQESVAVKGELGHVNLPGKAEQTVAARSDLAVLRSDTASVPSDRGRARPSPLTAQSPVQEAPRLDVPREAPQPRPISTQADSAGVPVQSADPVSVSANAASSSTSLPVNGSNDEPRLQDVKILGARTIELAPGTTDGAGQGTTVKVLDLQLQPETLGRIGAQLKQTAGGLEVRLEPSLMETAQLLKEDKLALQRILGVLGSISEPAVVRIVEPVGDQKQADGQEALVDLDLSEAGQSGGHETTSGDLYGEGNSNESTQNPQTVAEQDGPDSSRQRASDDIYI